MTQYNVLIIGGGPAGCKCAEELAHGGKKVGLIEEYAVGGTCLNRGCIPSKTYLYAVEILDVIKKAKRHGIAVSEPEVIWEDVKKRKDMNVKMLGMGLAKRLKDAGVEIIEGRGVLTGEHEVTVGDEVYQAEDIVLAYGTTPLFIPIMQKGEYVVSSTEILDLPSIPESLCIIGGGVTGVEMASVFSALGTKVTIIELQDALLPSQDKEIAEQLKKSLEKKGCDVHLQAQVLSTTDGNGNAVIQYKNAEGSEETLDASYALVCIGRAPCYDLEELEQIGIQHDGKYVELQEDQYSTSVSHIHMIGDCVFRNLTAYGAEREGTAVAKKILGTDFSVNYNHIPVAVFSHPEVGSIGLTEQQAEEKGIAYEVKKSPYSVNAKAVILGEREGLTKIIVEKSTQKILGVHIIGAGAADLIHQAFLAVMQELTVDEWLQVVWAHPVISEVFKEALES